MSNALNCSLIDCPYCGEQLEILVDNSTGSQRYIEDCQVCCAPIEITVEIGLNGEILEVLARTESD